MKLKIEIEIPEPKFKQGDFVELREDDDKEDFLIVAQVHEVHICGTWDVLNGGLIVRQGADVYAFDDPDRAVGTYTIVFQEGCWTPLREPLRPGKSLTYSLRELEQWARPIEYSGKVWSIDTLKNLDAREKLWQASDLCLMAAGRRTRAITLD